MAQGLTGAGTDGGPCPCCFYVRPAGQETFCDVCDWEDDGQGDDTADEVRGGPNGDLSLTQGRYNFARIGASDWSGLLGERASPPLHRAPGFPFASVPRLTTLPPLTAWPHWWTLSFHLKETDPGVRWTRAYRALVDRGFAFLGTYEWKDATEPRWAHPRFLRHIDSDPGLQSEAFLKPDHRAMWGAWFLAPRDGGARLVFQSVYRFGPSEEWNAPAIMVQTWLDRPMIVPLFGELLRALPSRLAACTASPFGLRTVAELSEGAAIDPFFGETFIEAPHVPPGLVLGFEELFGTGHIQKRADGLLFSTLESIRRSYEEERKVHEFFNHQMRQVALSLLR